MGFSMISRFEPTRFRNGRCGNVIVYWGRWTSVSTFWASRHRDWAEGHWGFEETEAGRGTGGVGGPLPSRTPPPPPPRKKMPIPPPHCTHTHTPCCRLGTKGVTETHRSRRPGGLRKNRGAFEFEAFGALATTPIHAMISRILFWVPFRCVEEAGGLWGGSGAWPGTRPTASNFSARGVRVWTAPHHPTSCDAVARNRGESIGEF